MFRMRTMGPRTRHWLGGALACAAIACASGWTSARAADAPSETCIAGAPLSNPQACPPPPLRATAFPMLFDLPMSLDARQFAAEAAPNWAVGMHLRRASEPFSGGDSFQVTLNQSVPNTPLAVSITGTMTTQAPPPGMEFVAPSLRPAPQQPTASITMRVGTATESQAGWYLFAASNHDSLRWTLADAGFSNGNRMAYQGGRVDMGNQVGFGLDLAGRLEGMQLGLVYSQHEIDTRRGGSDEDMIGMMLSRRR